MPAQMRVLQSSGVVESSGVASSPGTACEVWREVINGAGDLGCGRLADAA